MFKTFQIAGQKESTRLRKQSFPFTDGKWCEIVHILPLKKDKSCRIMPILNLKESRAMKLVEIETTATSIKLRYQVP